MQEGNIHSLHAGVAQGQMYRSLSGCWRWTIWCNAWPKRKEPNWERPGGLLKEPFCCRDMVGNWSFWDSVKSRLSFQIFQRRFLVFGKSETAIVHLPIAISWPKGGDGQHAPNGRAQQVFLGFLSSRAAAVARPRGSCLGRSLMLGALEVCAAALRCPKGQKSRVLPRTGCCSCECWAGTRCSGVRVLCHLCLRLQMFFSSHPDLWETLEISIFVWAHITSHGFKGELAHL